MTNPLLITSQLLRNEGFAGLYSGLSAGLLRQVIYTGSRLGLYDMFTDLARTVSTPAASMRLERIERGTPAR